MEKLEYSEIDNKWKLRTSTLYPELPEGRLCRHR